MSPKIHQSFWADEAVEQLDSEAKLVLLWLITCQQTNILGVCQASPRRFQLDTSLPPEALNRAIQALSGTVEKIGQTIFVKNFIRHQFGTGTKLTSNNIFKSIQSHFQSVKDPNLRAAIVAEYPELEGLGKGFEAQRKGTGTEEGEGTNSYALPENEKEAVEWCAAAGVPPDAAIRYFHQCAGRGWVDGAGRPIKSWSSHAKHRYTQEQIAPLHGTGKTGKPPSSFDLRKAIENKEAEMFDLKRKHYSEHQGIKDGKYVAPGWRDEPARLEYVKLKNEVKALKDKFNQQAA